ncbi:Putative Morphogenesis protein [[Torrubiella] hemipterigena]|nr:Putative Morphogenesis protein [[Torrubiella] hemipterigena]
MAAWWAFEQKDTGKGFDGGYQAWLKAADATSHLFFAYLRSMSPEGGLTGIDLIPRALQKLLDDTEYPPKPTNLYVSKTNKLVMVVDKVSPTPFALLRRASHFQFRESDVVLSKFSAYDDPVEALTEECHRVLKAVSAANQSQVSSLLHSTSLRDASWSRFEDIGFSNALTDEEAAHERLQPIEKPQGLRSTPASGNDLGRPTTPSWADFLSAGFVDENSNTGMLLPPDQVLPPIEVGNRQRSSQSHHPRLESDRNLEPGELASIAPLNLDDAFWWVWMSSLAPEETVARKSAFGRCAVIEIHISNGQWLVLEEMVAGSAPEPNEGAYIAEKKSFFSWTKRSRTVSRRKTVTGKQGAKPDMAGMADYKSSSATESQAKIQAKALQIRAIQEKGARLSIAEEEEKRRRESEAAAQETRASTIPVQIAGDATSAMKWATTYDKGAVKETYLNNENAGRGTSLTPATSIAASVTPSATSNAPVEKANPPPTVPAKTTPSVAPVPPTPVAKDVKTAVQTPAPAADADKPLPVRKPVPSKDDTNEPAQNVSASAEAKPPATPPKDEKPKAAEKLTVAEPEESVKRASIASSQTTTPSLPSVSSVPQSKPLPASQSTQTIKGKDKGGLRKLFTRKNRNSKLPGSYSTDALAALSQTNEEAPSPAVPAKQADVPVAAPVAKKIEDKAPSAATEESLAKSATEVTNSEVTDESAKPSATPNAEQSKEAESASQAKRVSQFNQGPLTEQPAFAPDSEEDSTASTPTPVANEAKSDATDTPKSSSDVATLVERKPTEENATAGKEAAPATTETPTTGLTNTAGPGVQDRWAQIRKNAANRAAQRQADERSRDGRPKQAEADGDTSGEETIESRVARIKARVAELTGNMEGTAYPNNANAGANAAKQ